MRWNPIWQESIPRSTRRSHSCRCVPLSISSPKCSRRRGAPSMTVRSQRRTMTEKRRQAAEKRGRRSETFAALLLRLKGYRILGRRVRTHAGEIDLIARAPSGLVCVIEVKARADEALAVDSVGQRQQGRIARAVVFFFVCRLVLVC